MESINCIEKKKNLFSSANAKKKKFPTHDKWSQDKKLKSKSLESTVAETMQTNHGCDISF